MKKTSKRKKHIPFFLIPKIRKRHVPPIFKDHETQWKLFAEGALRNKVFHDDVIRRGKTCLACKRHFNHEHADVSSKIDKHHHCYMRLCIGNFQWNTQFKLLRTRKNYSLPIIVCPANTI